MNEFIPVLQSLIGLDNHAYVEWLTDWGGPLGAWIVLQFVCIFAGWRITFRIAFLAALTYLTNSWLKWLFVEPRPFHIDHELTNFGAVGDFGMPSGHAQGAAAFWGGLAIEWRRYRVVLVALLSLAIAVGLTRIYLAVHSPAQVLVGLVIGFATIAVVFTLWERVTTTLSQLSFSQQWLTLVVVMVAAIGVSEFLLYMQADFVIPQLWIEGFAKADGLETVAPAELNLFANSAPLMVGLGGGFAAVAILHQRWPATLTTTSQRWLCVLAALLLNLLVIAALGSAFASGIAYLLFPVTFLQPIVALYFPMRLLHLRSVR